VCHQLCCTLMSPQLPPQRHILSCPCSLEWTWATCGAQWCNCSPREAELCVVPFKEQSVAVAQHCAPFLHHPRAQSGCCWTDTSPSPAAPPSVCPQVPVTLEEVTVHVSAEEWALLEEWQRELHREVTAATAQLLASLGRAPQGPLRPWLHVPIRCHGDRKVARCKTQRPASR